MLRIEADHVLIGGRYVQVDRWYLLNDEPICEHDATELVAATPAP